MKEEINIQIITSEHLKQRYGNLNTQLAKFRNLFVECNYSYKFHQINSPSNTDIEHNINNYKDKVDLNKDIISDEVFKNQIMPMNTNQLSNTFKHINAFELIKNNKTKYNFIIEDDIVIIDEFINNYVNQIYEIFLFIKDNNIKNNIRNNNDLE